MRKEYSFQAISLDLYKRIRTEKLKTKRFYLRNADHIFLVAAFWNKSVEFLLGRNWKAADFSSGLENVDR